jgi:hypothetical protein
MDGGLQVGDRLELCNFAACIVASITLHVKLSQQTRCLVCIMGSIWVTSPSLLLPKLLANMELLSNFTCVFCCCLLPGINLCLPGDFKYSRVRKYVERGEVVFMPQHLMMVSDPFLDGWLSVPKGCHEKKVLKNITMLSAHNVGCFFFYFFYFSIFSICFWDKVGLHG